MVKNSHFKKRRKKTQRPLPVDERLKQVLYHQQQINPNSLVLLISLVSRIFCLHLTQWYGVIFPNANILTLKPLKFVLLLK